VQLRAPWQVAHGRIVDVLVHREFVVVAMSSSLFHFKQKNQMKARGREKKNQNEI
jgi:hypothetical protein